VYCKQHNCEMTGFGNLVFCPKCEREKKPSCPKVVYLWLPLLSDGKIYTEVILGPARYLYRSIKEAKRHHNSGGRLYMFVSCDVDIDWKVMYGYPSKDDRVNVIPTERVEQSNYDISCKC